MEDAHFVKNWYLQKYSASSTSVSVLIWNKKEENVLELPTLF